jgi:hypothetical protein
MYARHQRGYFFNTQNDDAKGLWSAAKKGVHEIMDTNNHGPQKYTEQSEASVVSVEAINRQTHHHILPFTLSLNPFFGDEFIFFNCLIDAWA